jgi:hypothetical protein
MDGFEFLIILGALATAMAMLVIVTPTPDRSHEPD